MTKTTTTGSEILDVGARVPTPRPTLKTEADRRRILLVDDDEQMREFLAALLSREGYTVDTVHSCLDGFLQVIRSYYHCLILDLLFPDVDGLFLHEQVKRLDPDLALRTILITGSDDENPLLRRARDLKLPILRKPISNRGLFELLDRFCIGTVN
jgi:DNA-binding NtrC family response regulator